LNLVSGYQLVVQALVAHEVTTVFHITGAPNIPLTRDCEAAGIKLVGVRHEQAAAAAAQAYARVSGRPGVCLAPAGPAIANMVSAVSHATHEQVPIIALGGSGPRDQKGTGSFQEMNEYELMIPAAKKAMQIHSAKLVGSYISEAFRVCQSGAKGAVYVDLPADMLYQEIDPDDCFKWSPGNELSRPSASNEDVQKAIEILSQAERPLVVGGSGVIWSRASSELREFIDISGIPFYPTPQSRGIVPDDHTSSFPAARSTAFKQADVVLVVGTRANFIIGHFAPPRWHADLKVIGINIDPVELGRNKSLEIAISADAKMALAQLNKLSRAKFYEGQYADWIETLTKKQEQTQVKSLEFANSNAVPIHPLRLMREIRELLPRNTVVIEDGHDTLGFCRHSIPSFESGHRINPGTLGNVGVGIPFGMGAKAAKPDVPVVVISGDSAFGWNGMEIDTCVRENLPITIIVCNNAGITARSEDKSTMMPSQDLGWIDYHKIAIALGGIGIKVDSPEQLKPALKEALSNGKTTVVNVIVDKTVASATNTGFTGVMGDSYQS
jgi:thiamine pyrophosphate-dependent acetolactate synthase large subunit-like protein